MKKTVNIVYEGDQIYFVSPEEELKPGDWCMFYNQISEVVEVNTNHAKILTYCVLSKSDAETVRELTGKDTKEGDISTMLHSFALRQLPKIVASTDERLTGLWKPSSEMFTGIPPKETEENLPNKGQVPIISEGAVKKCVSETGLRLKKINIEVYESGSAYNKTIAPFWPLKTNGADEIIFSSDGRTLYNSVEVADIIHKFSKRFVANTETAYRQKEINDWIKDNV